MTVPEVLAKLEQVAEDPGRLANLMERVDIDESGCWMWTGKVTPYGYGRAPLADAHRAVYEAIWGRTPRLHLHHECEQRLCVNPGHLLLVEPGMHRTMHRRS